MSSIEPKSVNLNTLLLAGVLGLCGWTLFTVSGMSAIAAAQTERLNGHDRDLVSLRTKIDAAETDLVLLKIELAREVRQEKLDNR